MESRENCILLLTRYWWVDQTKGNKMGEEWTKQGGEEKCGQSSGGKNLKDKPTWKT